MARCVHRRTVKKALGRPALILLFAALTLVFAAWGEAQTPAQAAIRGEALFTPSVAIAGGLAVLFAAALLVLRRQFRRLALNASELRGMNERLAQCEERFRTMVDFTHDWEYWIGPDKRLIYVSPSCERITGYAAEEFFADPSLLISICAPEDRELVRGHMDAFADLCEVAGIEFSILRRDGELRRISHRCRVVHGRGGEFLGRRVSNRDITDRAKAQWALQESQRRMQVLLANLPGMAYRCLNEPDWPMEFVSEGCLALTGLTAEELTGSAHVSFGELIHPEDRQRVWNAVQAAVAADAPYHVTYRLCVRGGDERWVWEAGRPVFGSAHELQALEGLITDITEQRQTELALTEANAQMEALFCATGDGIVVLNPAGEVLFTNEAAARALGYDTREQILGMTYDAITAGVEWLDESGAPRALVDLPGRVALAGIDAPATTVHYRRRGTTDERWMVFKASPVLNASGEVQCAVVVATDITHTKRIEHEARRLEARLLQTQKLESLATLAGGAAHHFNNLLHAIMGFADLALEEAPPETAGRHHIHDIKGAAKRAADLSQQLLACSGHGKFVLEHLDLSRLVEGLQHLLEPLASDYAVFRVQLARELPGVEADPAQLRQLISNLVVNAIEAVRQKGGSKHANFVLISTGAMEYGPEYFSTCYLDEGLREGCYVHIEVSDTGCGMDPEVQARLFDPFFSTKLVGRGLGMPAVLGIVRAHHGAIRVDSAVGEGTTVRVILPALTQPALAAAAEAEANTDWRGEGVVLIVDDEETVRTVGAGMLERLGFRVLTACDGREAVEVFRREAQAIRLVLLDLSMPYMDGEQALRALRAIRADAKVVLSSGYGAEQISAQFGANKPAGFIQKPYELQRLIHELRRVLG